jgi:hypothetical protein
VFFYIEVIKCTPRHYCLRCRQVIYKDLIFLNNLLASILALLRHNRDKDVNSCVTLCVLFQQRLICCRKRHSTQKNDTRKTQLTCIIPFSLSSKSHSVDELFHPLALLNFSMNYVPYFPLVQLCRFGIFQDILGKFFFRIITTLNFSKISEMKHNQGGFNNCL